MGNKLKKNQKPIQKIYKVYNSERDVLNHERVKHGLLPGLGERNLRSQGNHTGGILRGSNRLEMGQTGGPRAKER